MPWLVGLRFSTREKLRRHNEGLKRRKEQRRKRGIIFQPQKKRDERAGFVSKEPDRRGSW